MLTLVACHADDNDPAGQAEELADPVRREHAIGRLQSIFGQRLVEAKGDRSAPGVKEFCDVTHEALVKTYLEHPEDTGNGLKIMQLMSEMRDARTYPALLKALEWQMEVNEDHAVTAARTLTEIDIDETKRGEVVAKVGAALRKVEGTRGVDARMRKSFIEVLGKLKDKRTTDVLVEIALNQDPKQNFLFNLLAAQQLVATADPAAVEPMVKALYMFDPQNPQMRMNQDAEAVLVAIGRPALEPLLEALRGKNPEVNKLVEQSIDAIRKLDAQFASKLNKQTLIAHEATMALGRLGLPEALDALIAEAKSESPERRTAGAIALVNISRKPEDDARVVEAIKHAYDNAEKPVRPQLLVAMRHLYAEPTMPILQKLAQTGDDEFPPIQVTAFESYALLADKKESQSLKGLLAKDELIKAQAEVYSAVIAAAEACDRDVACWTGKLKDSNKVVVRKAANMLARLGQGNEAAISGLVEALGHSDLEVRNEALSAIDRIATKGSKAAVEKINNLEATEEGRSIWSNFKREALPARSRLMMRAAS